MDLWHYPSKVNNKPGVMELWDFPNGQPMEQNNLAEETRLITRDIVAITQNLEDAYPSNDIRQTLNYLATSDNRHLQLAYNIVKQLVESHQSLEYQLNKANRKIEHQQAVLQQVQPEFVSYDDESDYESEYSDEEYEEIHTTTNIPFFGSPVPPAPVQDSVSPTTPLVPEEFYEDIYDQAEANGFVEEGLPSSESDQDEVMNRYHNLMFEDDFSCKPRLTRNNSQGMFNMNAPIQNRHARNSRRLSRKKFEEAHKNDLPSPHMKKLARVRSNPNSRRFREKKSYLTRREQWNMVFPAGSPKTTSDVARNGQHKSSISLDSTALGLNARPILDMNRNVPTVISSKRASPEDKDSKQSIDKLP